MCVWKRGYVEIPTGHPVVQWGSDSARSATKVRFCRFAEVVLDEIQDLTLLKLRSKWYMECGWEVSGKETAT